MEHALDAFLFERDAMLMSQRQNDDRTCMRMSLAIARRAAPAMIVPTLADALAPIAATLTRGGNDHKSDALAPALPSWCDR